MTIFHWIIGSLGLGGLLLGLGWFLISPIFIVARRAVLAFVVHYWRQIIAVVVVLLAAWWAIHSIHAYGGRQFEAGRQQVLAADALAVQAAQKQADQHVTDAAAAGVAMHTALDVALPKIEVTTHDAAEKIRTIYLAAPGAGVDCQRPAGVQ
ncbi:MAG: hypothetical protein ABI114_11110, partial [Rhodanobacter sp.]